MKIKAEHLSLLQSLVAPLDTPALREEYRAAGLSPMRYRWDLLFRVPYHARFPLIDAMYQYANDTHIDTALRHITGTR